MSTEPSAINVEAFRFVHDIISRHPEQHDQADYEWTTECGTTRCVAGWGAFHALQADMLPGENLHDVLCRLDTGLDIHDIAARHFGLDEDQAMVLFSARLSNEKARMYVQEFADGDMPIPWGGLGHLDSYWF